MGLEDGGGGYVKDSGCKEDFVVLYSCQREKG
jgi:hypothetical protein